MEERLQKILSSRGIASRRKAEELIEAGLVSVNGVKAYLGDKADPDKDIIKVKGARLPGRGDLVYIMLNKPRGYITSMSDEKGRPTVIELVQDIGERVYPVGRLDWDSEGLLLLTNDGDFANMIAHPSNNKEKTYLVTVEGNVERALDKLRSPMVIDGYRIRPAKVDVIAPDRISVKIKEGRNRQVRKMCAACGLTVVNLKRTAVGSVELGKLKLGTWRELTKTEIESLKNLSK